MLDECGDQLNIAVESRLPSGCATGKPLASAMVPPRRLIARRQSDLPKQIVHGDGAALGFVGRHGIARHAEKRTPAAAFQRSTSTNASRVGSAGDLRGRRYYFGTRTPKTGVKSTDCAGSEAQVTDTGSTA